MSQQQMHYTPRYYTAESGLYTNPAMLNHGACAQQHQDGPPTMASNSHYQAAGHLTYPPGPLAPPNNMSSTTLTSSPPCTSQPQDIEYRLSSALDDFFHAPADPTPNANTFEKSQHLDNATGPAEIASTPMTQPAGGLGAPVEDTEQSMNSQVIQESPVGSITFQNSDGTSTKFTPMPTSPSNPLSLNNNSHDLPGNPADLEGGIPALNEWENNWMPTFFDNDGNIIEASNDLGIFDDSNFEQQNRSNAINDGQLRDDLSFNGSSQAAKDCNNPPGTLLLRSHEEVQERVNQQQTEPTSGIQRTSSAQMNAAQRMMAHSQRHKSGATAGHRYKVEKPHRKPTKKHDRQRHYEESITSESAVNGQIQVDDPQLGRGRRAAPSWPDDPFETSVAENATIATASFDTLRKQRLNAQSPGRNMPFGNISYQPQLTDAGNGLAYNPNNSMTALEADQGAIPTQQGNPSPSLNPTHMAKRKRDAFSKPQLGAGGKVSGPGRFRAISTTDLANPAVSAPPATTLRGDKEDGPDEMARLSGETGDGGNENEERDEDDLRNGKIPKKSRQTKGLVYETPAPMVRRAAHLAPSTKNLNRGPSSGRPRGNATPRSVPSPVAVSIAPFSQISSPADPPRSGGKQPPPGFPTPQSMKNFNDQAQSLGDGRKRDPETPAERKSLQDALQASRAAYYEWTGANAPVTNSRASYLTQWQQLQTSFHFAWDMCSNKILKKEPNLFKLPNWEGSIEDWPTPMKDERYFAPFKYGHRAPMTGDRKLVNLPGEVLEEASKAKDRESFLAGMMTGLRWMAPAVWSQHYG